MVDETKVTTSQDATPVDQQVSSQQSAPPLSPDILAPEKSFLDSLPEDLRKEASLTNIKDLQALAKGYVSAQRMLGSSIRIPGPDASDEAKKEFYDKITNVEGVVKLPDPKDKDSVDKFLSKLGRPSTKDDYKLASISKETNVNAEAMEQFKSLAHNLGLNEKQADALANFELQRYQVEVTRNQHQLNSAKDTLKKMWGPEYDNRISLAKELANHYGQQHPKELQEFINSSSANNPLVVMAFAELGKQYRESGAIKGDIKANYGLTSEEARARIAEIKSNPLHPYYTEQNYTKKAKIVSEVQRLYEIANPSSGES